MARDEDDYGGDSACWLSRVCPECGALLDDPSAPCWRCGLGPDRAGAEGRAVRPPEHPLT